MSHKLRYDSQQVKYSMSAQEVGLQITLMVAHLILQPQAVWFDILAEKAEAMLFGRIIS